MFVVAACNGTSVPRDHGAEVAQVAHDLLSALSARDAARLQSIVTDGVVMSAREYGFDDEYYADSRDQWDLNDLLTLIDELNAYESLDNFGQVVDLVRPLEWVDGPIVTIASDAHAAQASGRIRVRHEYGVDVTLHGEEVAWFADYFFAGLVDLVQVDQRWQVSAFQLRPITVDESRAPDLKLHSHVFGPDNHFTLDAETIFCWGWANHGGTGWMAYDAWIVHVPSGEFVWQDSSDFWISADELMNWWGCVNSIDLPVNLMPSGAYDIVVELWGGLSVQDLTLMDQVSLRYEHTASPATSGTEEPVRDLTASATDTFDADGVLAAATRFLDALANYDADGFLAETVQDFSFHYLSYQDYDEAYYANLDLMEAVRSWNRDEVALDLADDEFFLGVFHPFTWVPDSLEVNVERETSTGWVLGRIELDHVYFPMEFGRLNPVEQRWHHQYDVFVDLAFVQGRWFVTQYHALAILRDPTNPPMINLVTSLTTTTGGSRLSPSDEALFCWAWENQGGTGSIGYELTIYKDDQLRGEESDQFWVSANEEFVWWDCVPFPQRLHGHELLEPGTYAVEILILEGLDEYELEPAEAGMRIFTVVAD